MNGRSQIAIVLYRSDHMKLWSLWFSLSDLRLFGDFVMWSRSNTVQESVKELNSFFLSSFLEFATCYKTLFIDPQHVISTQLDATRQIIDFTHILFSKYFGIITTIFSVREHDPSNGIAERRFYGDHGWCGTSLSSVSKYQQARRWTWSVVEQLWLNKSEIGEGRKKNWKARQLSCLPVFLPSPISLL